MERVNRSLFGGGGERRSEEKQGNLCWNCGHVGKCRKVFPNGRPNEAGKCKDYIEMPPDPPRFTHREMATALGCSVRKIERLLKTQNGAGFLLLALEAQGIYLTYEIINKRIFFYRDDAARSH